MIGNLLGRRRQYLLEAEHFSLSRGYWLLRAVVGRVLRAAAPAVPAACDARIDEMGAYLSGDLAGGSRKRFVKHIRNCSECHDKLLVLELSLNLDPVGSMATSAERPATFARTSTEAAARI
jgi:hypothetical protein